MIEGVSSISDAIQRLDQQRNDRDQELERITKFMLQAQDQREKDRAEIEALQETIQKLENQEKTLTGLKEQVDRAKDKISKSFLGTARKGDWLQWSSWTFTGLTWGVNILIWILEGLASAEEDSEKADNLSHAKWVLGGTGLVFTAGSTAITYIRNQKSKEIAQANQFSEEEITQVKQLIGLMQGFRDLSNAGDEEKKVRKSIDESSHETDESSSPKEETKKKTKVSIEKTEYPRSFQLSKDCFSKYKDLSPEIKAKLPEHPELMRWVIEQLSEDDPLRIKYENLLDLAEGKVPEQPSYSISGVAPVLKGTPTSNRKIGERASRNPLNDSSFESGEFPDFLTEDSDSTDTSESKHKKGKRASSDQTKRAYLHEFAELQDIFGDFGAIKGRNQKYYDNFGREIESPPQSPERSRKKAEDVVIDIEASSSYS